MDRVKTIKQVADELHCSKQNVSYHLKKLIDSTEGIKLTQNSPDSRQTLITSEGVKLLRERITGTAKEEPPNGKQKPPNIYRQKSDKDQTSLAANGKMLDLLKDQLERKEEEIKRLREELMKEQQRSEAYYRDFSASQENILKITAQNQSHTEKIIEKFALTVNNQQEIIEEFFEKTAKLVSDQQYQIAEITKNTQRLQQNQQQLSWIEKQKPEKPLEIEIKKPLKQAPPAWTTALLYFKAVWAVLKGE